MGSPSAAQNAQEQMHHIHHIATPTTTSDRSVCRFGEMCRSARCPWCHPNHSGTTRQPQWEAGSEMLPPPAAHTSSSECATRRKKREERNWEERTQQSNWAQGRPTQVVRRAPTGHTQQCTGGPRGASTAATTKCGAYRASHQHTSLPLPPRGTRELHKGGGCAPRTGRCPPRGWQQGHDQPTARGTVNVVR